MVRAANGDYKRAHADFTKAIELEPDDFFYYANRANCEMKMDKPGKSLRDYDKVFI